MSYLDIDNLYKNKDVLLFKQCYALEKIHGCFVAKTPIRMANNTYKAISTIKEGEYVLGYQNGIIVPSKVLASLNNGIGDEWIYIAGTRYGAGRGGSKFAIYCTLNHKIYNQKKKQFIEAKKMHKGNKVFLIRSDYDISYIQRQILVGKLLGDTYLRIDNNTAHIAFSQKKAHKEYLFYLMHSLGDLANPRIDYRISQYGFPVVRTSTYRNYFIYKYFKSFLKDKKRTIPNNIKEMLDPIALAFWYMDDGSLSHSQEQEDSLMLHTCRYNLRENKLLVDALRKFDIHSTIRKHTFYRLAINAIDSIKFFSLIAPYVPKCMQYKLPKAFRGFKENLPCIQNKLKHTLTIQKILTIQKFTNKKIHSNKYDLTTETGNYFANDILVHNSSSHISFDIFTDIKDTSVYDASLNGIYCKVHYFAGGEKHENFIKLFDSILLAQAF